MTGEIAGNAQWSALAADVPRDMAIDFDEAGRFLFLLDPDADRFVISAIDDDKARVKAGFAEANVNGRSAPVTCQIKWGSILDPDIRRWAQERQDAGWAISVSAQAMKAGRRLLSEVAYFRVVFAEMDIGEPLQEWPIEPSFVVETSLGRFHVYWLLDPEAPMTSEQFAGVMMCLAETYGSDPDAKDAARTMRLPGTRNRKPGRGNHFVRITRETGARYTAAEIVAKFPAPPRPASTKTAAPRPYLNGGTPPDLDRFVEPLQAILPETYGTWIRIGMALHAASGGSAEGVALWDQWSAKSDKWVPGVCEAKWRTFQAGRGIDGGTIFALAGENGYRKTERRQWSRRSTTPHEKAEAPTTEVEQELASSLASGDNRIDWLETSKFGRPVANSQPNIDAFLASENVLLRTDEFIGRALVKWGNAPERELSTELLRTLRLKADARGLSPQKAYWDDVLLVRAAGNRFHSVRDWLDSLTHDGVSRLDGLLVRYAGAEDTELMRTVARKLGLAAVRRVRQPGCKFDVMPVLEGPQGAKKSTFVRTLAGSEWYCDSLALGADPKIVIEQTAGAWIVEIPEMTHLPKREVEHVKAMLSRQVDRARPSYGTLAVDIPRQFTLWGTVNDDEYLQDTSGNRRFWPIKVGKIDIEGLSRDREQIWAEASAAERTGESLELPPELWEAAAKQQAQRLVTDPWSAILVPLLEGKTGHVPIEDVNRRLDLPAKNQNSLTARRINAIMAGLGFKRTRQRKGDARIYVYSRLADGEPAQWLSLGSWPS